MYILLQKTIINKQKKFFTKTLRLQTLKKYQKLKKNAIFIFDLYSRAFLDSALNHVLKNWRVIANDSRFADFVKIFAEASFILLVYSWNEPLARLTGDAPVFFSRPSLDAHLLTLERQENRTRKRKAASARFEKRRNLMRNDRNTPLYTVYKPTINPHTYRWEQNRFTKALSMREIKRTLSMQIRKANACNKGKARERDY